MRHATVGVLFLLLGVGYCSAADPPMQPNVIVILSDDQGWGDFSLHGNTDLQTPHLDSIAVNGAQFERFFVQPVCSPTRAEFLTGRYHPRGGVRDVSTGGERLNLDEKTIADTFRAAGYATGAFGKWHNGSQYPYHPNGRGFDEYYGFTSGHWGDYFSPPLDHNGKTVVGNGFLADDLTSQSIAFIERQHRKPFFCYLAYNTPHSPMQVPDADWDRFKTKALKLQPSPPNKPDVPHTRAALAMCENLDGNVGRLLKALDNRKLAESTIVLFFCDNGPNGWRWNGGMKGRKGSTDEGGVRSPLFVRWPGKIPPGLKIQRIAGAIDILPTLAELTGVKRVGNKPLDGVSFARLLRSEKVDATERILFQHWNGRVSARSQTHRLDADGKLFDLTTDPGQLRDIAVLQPDTTTHLKNTVVAWRRDVLAGQTKADDRPFPVGDKAFPITTLPARDGVPHGTIQRSERAPNCSYFTNWTSREDSVTWSVDVATEGRYRAELLYTCRTENIGAKMELSLGTTKLTRKVETAHDPMAYGEANDRVPRVGESYMKDFKVWSLGEIMLLRGRGLLTLRATEIPGKQAIEVRSTVLTLLE